MHQFFSELRWTFDALSSATDACGDASRALRVAVVSLEFFRPSGSDSYARVLVGSIPVWLKFSVALHQFFSELMRTFSELSSAIDAYGDASWALRVAVVSLEFFRPSKIQNHEWTNPNHN